MTTVRLSEWETVGPDQCPALRGAHLADPQTRRLAAQLARERVLEVVELRSGLSVRAFSHVGRILLGDLVVTIEPKLGRTELLHLVRYAYGLRNLRLLDRVDFADGVEVLQDILVAQLQSEVTELVHRGLARRYVPRIERLSSPRGRLVVGELADGSFLHTAVLACAHHPRSSDFVLNRMLHAGLLLGASVAVDGALKMSVRRLATTFDGAVSPALVTASLLTECRRSLNRLVTAYEPALRIVELLHDSSSLTLDDGSTIRVTGFLFDMNRFFQALLLRFLSEHLPDYEVHAEEGIRDMIRFRPGANPNGRRAPRPRPDFVVKSRATRIGSRSRSAAFVGILDAKYRDLWARELPRDMLYQLSMYALSQPRPATATILYPTASPGAVDAVLELLEPISGGEMGFVALRPVILSKLWQAVGDPPNRTEGERLALEWIKPVSARTFSSTGVSASSASL